MVLMEEYFFVWLSFTVAETIAQSWKIFYHSFVMALAIKKCLLIKASLEEEMLQKKFSRKHTRSLALHLHHNLLQSHAYFSLHQASGWDMRGLQVSFPQHLFSVR
jgi:hypothetical protein